MLGWNSSDMQARVEDEIAWVPRGESKASDDWC